MFVVYFNIESLPKYASFFCTIREIVVKETRTKNNRNQYTFNIKDIQIISLQ